LYDINALLSTITLCKLVDWQRQKVKREGKEEVAIERQDIANSTEAGRQ